MTDKSTELAAAKPDFSDMPESVAGRESCPAIEPRIAVVTVSKDDLSGLTETLESASSQVGCGFRHIVVDSSENVHEVEKLASQYRVSFYWTPPRGIYDAMEFGLAQLEESEYCWFLNSGDVFAGQDSLDLVARRLREQNNQKPVWAVGKVLLEGKKKARVYGAFDKSQDIIGTVRKGRTWFPHSSTIVHVSSLRSVRPFQEKLEIAQDYLASLKVLTRFGPPIIIQEVLSRFKLGGLSSQKPIRAGLEAVKARVLIFGASQIPSETVNIPRIIFGRLLSKFFQMGQ